MSLFIALLVGVIIGTGLGLLFHSSLDFLLTYAIFGLCGGLAGLAKYYFALANTDIFSLVNAAGIVSSMIGALIFTLGFDAAHRFLTKTSDDFAGTFEEDLDDKG